MRRPRPPITSSGLEFSSRTADLGYCLHMGDTSTQRQQEFERLMANQEPGVAQAIVTVEAVERAYFAAVAAVPTWGAKTRAVTSVPMARSLGNLWNVVMRASPRWPGYAHRALPHSRVRHHSPFPTLDDTDQSCDR